jgi:hypothetical protein
MAQQQQTKDLLTRLADRGEQVVGRISDLPGAKNLLDRTTNLAKRMDDVQKQLRGLGPLEKRVSSLEKRLAKLEGTKSTRKRPATRSASSSRASTAKARRPPSSS